MAPFERIVDFRIIDRGFTLEKGELTPKGTYKRRVIEDNFSEISMGMSGDYQVALEEGSTMVRIGSLLFGPRS